MLPRIVPVSCFMRKATGILAAIRQDPSPLLITVRGRAAAVLLDVAVHHRLVRTIALLEGIIKGRTALAEGRTLSHEAMRKRILKRD